MILQEFSNEFDILYNNIMSNQAPGLDSYEKSVFLTKAQDEILKAYFDPKGNKFQEGFDGSERRQIDFSNLINLTSMTISSPGNIDIRTNGVGHVSLATDAFLYLNESVKVNRNGSDVQLLILPLKYTEYTRLMSKPYKRPLQYQAWRISYSENSDADIIVGANDTFTNAKYIVRYLKKPYPIILEKLNEGLSIDNYVGSDANGTPITLSSAASATKGLDCKLDPILHKEILQRAVELAKAAYSGDLQSLIALGQTSETNMGIVAQQQR